MTIVILGTLSVAAVPKFFEKSKFAEKAFFDDTLNALRFAQKIAIATGCEVQVSFTSTTYELKRRGTSGDLSCPGSGSTYALDVPHPGSGAVSYTGSESGISYSTFPASPIIFYPLGNVSANETVSIAGSSISVIKDTGFIYTL